MREIKKTRARRWIALAYSYRVITNALFNLKVGALSSLKRPLIPFSPNTPH